MQPPRNGLFIESLTWRDVEEALKVYDTVLLPIGARCKEHGLHLPLNTDWIVAEYLARRVADECPVLVLPTMQHGYYPAFIEYPGTISIDEATFRDAVIQICRSFARHGVRRFFVLNTGISTVPPLKAAQDQLTRGNVRMEFTDLRKLASAERQAIQQQPHGTHADELETSMMLYIAPQHVHLDRARPELAPDHPGPLTRNPSVPGVHSPTGAWGDPTLATREKGERLVEAIVREIVAAVRRA